MIPQIVTKAYDNVEEDNGQYDNYILTHYFHIYTLPKGSIYSPFRKDSHPSLSIQYWENRIMYTDFGTGYSGNIVHLLSCCSGIHNYNLLLYKLQTKEDIIIKHPLVVSNKINANIYSKIHYKTKATVIDIRVKKWDSDSVKYWKQYGINTKQCTFANIYPIDYYIINGITIKTDPISFAYKYSVDNTYKYKIYQPLNKKYKWVSNINKKCISLYDKIPSKCKAVIICSSMKDAMCVWCNTHIPTIALQNEIQSISKSLIKDLKDRCNNNLYILYDNDETGLKYAKKHAMEHDITNIIIPPFEQGKDISDYYIHNKQLMIKLINKYVNKQS